MKRCSVKLETKVSQVVSGLGKCVQGEFFKPFNSNSRYYKFVLVMKDMVNISQLVCRVDTSKRGGGVHSCNEFFSFFFFVCFYL